MGLLSSCRNAESLFPPRSLFHPTFLTSPDLCDVIARSLPEPDNTQHNSTAVHAYTYTHARASIYRNNGAPSSSVVPGRPAEDKDRQTCPPSTPCPPPTSAALTSASDAADQRQTAALRVWSRRGGWREAAGSGHRVTAVPVPQAETLLLEHLSSSSSSSSSSS